MNEELMQEIKNRLNSIWQAEIFLYATQRELSAALFCVTGEFTYLDDWTKATKNLKEIKERAGI